MATAKIATLLIRTLAKPIATQLKTQAASHESFRRVCIGIAQSMHKTEMALRYNLLPKAPPLPKDREKDGGDGDDSSSSSSSPTSHRPKVRPLNEAKAIANGANFLSEAFLFSIAAGLVILETYRSSAKSKKQRAQTRDGLEKMEFALRKLCALHNIDPRVLGLDDEDDDGDEGDAAAAEGGSDDDDVSEDARREAARHAAAMQHRRKQQEEMQRLQKAVDLLLRMAIQNGSIMGGEALDLQGILDGKDGQETQDSRNSQQATDAQSSPSSSSSPPPPTASSPILSEIAKQKAREFAQQSSVAGSAASTKTAS